MDLKHIEELSKDKDLTNAYFYSYLADFCKDDYKDDYEEDYNFEEIKEWQDLTDTQKETLLGCAFYYWLKDESNAGINKICDLVMLNQQKILQGKMEKWKFLRQLCNF